VEHGNDAVFAFIREHEGRSTLVLANFSPEAQRAAIPTEGPVRDLLTEAEVPTAADGTLDIDLEPYGYRWLER
jgi:hypothetical protein